MPSAECLRSWLYSSIQAATAARACAFVANFSRDRSSNSKVECQDSMTALSSADPGLPMDWEMESRWQACRNRVAVYSLPWSVLSRFRLNSDKGYTAWRSYSQMLRWGRMSRHNMLGLERLSSG
jgi:hypothetical protein